MGSTPCCQQNGNSVDVLEAPGESAANTLDVLSDEVMESYLAPPDPADTADNVKQAYVLTGSLPPGIQAA